MSVAPVDNIVSNVLTSPLRLESESYSQSVHSILTDLHTQQDFPSAVAGVKWFEEKEHIALTAAKLGWLCAAGGRPLRLPSVEHLANGDGDLIRDCYTVGFEAFKRSVLNACKETITASKRHRKRSTPRPDQQRSETTTPCRRRLLTDGKTQMHQTRQQRSRQTNSPGR